MLSASRTDETKPRALVHLERAEAALSGRPVREWRETRGLWLTWSVVGAAIVILAVAAGWLS